MDVRNVGLDPQSGSAVVILQVREDGPVLPIRIGQPEAQAIAMELYKVAAPRPLTHDLVKRILDTAGVVLRRVRITELREGTFFAALVLVRAGQEIEVDSRPSDAIALALRFACPILVSRTLLGGAIAGEIDEGQQDIVAKVWGLSVQDLTPALAESLGYGAATGVLVSNVEVAENAILERGDVIVAVDGVQVGSASALRAIAASGDRARRVEVWRGGVRIVLLVGPGTQVRAAAQSSD